MFFFVYESMYDESNWYCVQKDFTTAKTKHTHLKSCHTHTADNVRPGNILDMNVLQKLI